ncbi:DUF349 domain-containing protein [Modestobacter sp. SSW1-42]|uniref:DUF349 domain-containing protein n=1 Tax=Modestobacter sp. SSW1-42 TaxID=596372 RepID=UPI00398622CD
MSSTENTGDRTQQPATAPEEQPETAVLEVAPVDEGPLGATPDAAVPDADDPGPVAEQAPPAEVTSEADAVPPVDTDAPAPAAEDVAVTEVAPVDEGPLGATPDAAEPQDAPTSPAPAPAGGGRAPSDVPSVVPAMPASDPSAWGRVDEDGTVYVKTAGGERSVGSWQAGAPAEGLAHYGRRFDDLATEVTLLEARLAAHTGNPGEIRTKAQELADTIPLAQAVGDLDSLSARARAMVSMADTAVAANRAEKAAQRAVQVQRKEALAAEAEDIAENSSQWKAAGDRLKAIVEEWKTIKGIDRKTDEALWQRFAAARDAFGRRRGAHFAQLDTQRAEARAAKSELIAEAERLSTSTEWGPTSAAMRALMDRWKAVPRVGRDTDDDLWKKFRGAQDVFFAARTANDQARSSDETANQKAKEELLAEAEKIEVGKNPRPAQDALRKIQERYDAIGHVPRGVMRQLEDRMRAVEEKVRGAAESSRPRVEPENPLLTSMRAAVTKAEDQLAKAQASGNAKRISEAEANLATRREWLAEAEKASSRR